MPAARAERQFDGLTHLHVMKNQRQFHRAAGRAVLYSCRVTGKRAGHHHLKPLTSIPDNLKVHFVLNGISAVSRQFDGEEVQVSGVEDLALHQRRDDSWKLLRQIPAHNIESALVVAWMWVQQGRVIPRFGRLSETVVAEV